MPQPHIGRFELLHKVPLSGCGLSAKIWSSPSGGWPAVPRDGQGLNAFAMAALISGRADETTWIRTTRRWTLVAWLFLSIGLILGGLALIIGTLFAAWPERQAAASWRTTRQP